MRVVLVGQFQCLMHQLRCQRSHIYFRKSSIECLVELPLIIGCKEHHHILKFGGSLLTRNRYSTILKEIQ